MNNLMMHEILNKYNLKATPQRILLIETIKKHGHATIDTIFEDIRKSLPSISLATIYKNLKTLTQAGLLKEVHADSHKVFYEMNFNDHIHFICKNCFKIIDKNVDINLIKDFFSKVEGDEDLVGYEVNFFVLCKNCASKS